MADRAAGTARPDYDAAAVRIENSRITGCIEESTAVERFADQPSVGFNTDRVDYALEFSGRPQLVAQGKRSHFVWHGKIETCDAG